MRAGRPATRRTSTCARFECLGRVRHRADGLVDGVYVGPLELADAERIVADLRAGREQLEAKQLVRRPCADPRAATRGEGA